MISITTLWAVFKLVLLPIGGQLAAIYPPTQFAAVFALIWGSYMIAGTVTGFIGSLAFCVAIVLANSLPAPFFALALLISISNTLLELYSPRGTDDFTMATGNALICWAFGAWVFG